MSHWTIPRDLRHAARVVGRQPGFSAAVVLTLALGIAANTTVFTIVNGVLLRALPFDEPDRVVSLGMRNLGNAQSQGDGVSYPELGELRKATRTLVDIVAVTEQGMSLSDDAHPAQRVRGAYVSWNTFALLRQPPAIGRDFAEPDDQPGGAPAMVLSELVWRTRYGSDPAIVGRTVRVDGAQTTVIGVMPRGFAFPMNADLWLPVAALPDGIRSARHDRRLEGVARLREGVTREEAATELSGIVASLAARFPDSTSKLAPRVETFRPGIGGPLVGVLFTLLGAVALVLLIACANVANLLLARAFGRAREVSVRVALGASRWRIVRQLLVESFLFAAAGAAAGVLLSYGGVALFVHYVPGAPPYWLRLQIDLTVAIYVGAISVASAVACGLVPAWHASRPSIAMTLKDVGRANVGGRGARRWTGAFVVAQVAMSVALLTGAGVMVEALLAATRTDLGVDARRILQMHVEPPLRAYERPDSRALFFAQLDDRLALPGSSRIALTSHAPLGGAELQRVVIEDQGEGNTTPAAEPVSAIYVGPRYFEAVGTPVLLGRVFGSEDMTPGRDSVVINQRFADTYFSRGTAVGRRFRLEDPRTPETSAPPQPSWATVIGVVGNVRQRQLQSGAFDPAVYSPYSADAPQTMAIVARMETNPDATISAIRERLRAVDADVPVFDISMVDEALARSRGFQQTIVSMFGIFSLAALGLASLGLYAVTAYAVSRRAREVGLRVALGATPRRVWWELTRPTVRQLAVGLALGAVGAVGVVAVLRAIFVSARDASALDIAAASALLLVVGVAACLVSGFRATRLDPIVALRDE